MTGRWVQQLLTSHLMRCIRSLTIFPEGNYPLCGLLRSTNLPTMAASTVSLYAWASISKPSINGIRTSLIIRSGRHVRDHGQFLTAIFSIYELQACFFDAWPTCRKVRASHANSHHQIHHALAKSLTNKRLLSYFQYFWLLCRLNMCCHPIGPML